MTENRDDQDQWRRDYDQRQYRRMVERIDAFLADDLDIDQLNADLGTLHNALEGDIEKRWENDFTTLCNELCAVCSGP